MDFKKLQLVAVALIGLNSACTSKTASQATPIVASSFSSASTTNIGNAPVRECSIPVTNSNESALESALSNIAQSTVYLQETPVTVCVAANPSPLSGFGASLRIEYEDDLGLHWVTFEQTDLVYSNQANNTFQIIYLDEYGYVQLDAYLGSNGMYSGFIQASDTTNNTIYSDEIDSFLQSISSTCAANPSACLDPIFLPSPTSGTASTPAEILQQADDAFAGQNNCVPYTLGNISFSPAMISQTLF